jgi:hypothetical protein
MQEMRLSVLEERAAEEAGQMSGLQRRSYFCTPVLDTGADMMHSETQ